MTNEKLGELKRLYDNGSAGGRGPFYDALLEMVTSLEIALEAERIKSQALEKDFRFQTDALKEVRRREKDLLDELYLPYSDARMCAEAIVDYTKSACIDGEALAAAERFLSRKPK